MIGYYDNNIGAVLDATVALAHDCWDQMRRKTPATGLGPEAKPVEQRAGKLAGPKRWPSGLEW